jgi:hypothetical protein
MSESIVTALGILRLERNRTIVLYVAANGVVTTRDLRREFLDYPDIIPVCNRLARNGLLTRSYDVWMLNAHVFCDITWHIQQFFTPTPLTRPSDDTCMAAQIDILCNHDACNAYHVFATRKTLRTFARDTFLPFVTTKRLIDLYKRADMIRSAGVGVAGATIYEHNGEQMADIAAFVDEVLTFRKAHYGTTPATQQL